MNSISKLFFILAFNLIASVPIYAGMEQQKSLDFPIQTEKLMKGDVHFFTVVMTPREMSVTYPQIFEIDSLLLLQEPDAQIVLSKSVFVINKPVGFFDDKQMTDENYVKHLMGDQKVKKTSPDTFLISVPGEFSHRYKTQMFFDADDVSTLPNSKIIKAVGAVKKLDVISQGASTIMFTESSNYSDHLLGAVSATSFIPLKEEKTLVIQYHLKALKKGVLAEKEIKQGLEDEMMAKKDLMNSYKVAQ